MNFYSVPRWSRPAADTGAGSSASESWSAHDDAFRAYDRPRAILPPLGPRKGFLFAAMLAGVALAVAYLVFFPRNYTSEIQILQDPRGLQVFGANELTPPGQTSEVNSALIETQIRVLTSDTVLKRVVTRLNLTEDPEFDGTDRDPIQAAQAIVRQLIGVKGPPETLEVVALRALQEKVRAQRVDRGYVIQLSVTAQDRDKAATIAQALADTYIEEETAAKQDLARRAGQEVGDRLEDLAARVKQAEDAAEAFKVANRLVGASGELVSAQELSALNLQLVAAQTRTSELKARAEQIKAIARSGAIPDTIAESVKSSTITSLRAQFAELDRLQADTAIRLGPRHPDTISLRAQAQRLRSQINAELSRIAAAAEGDYERARANEKSLTQSLQNLKKQALDVSQSLVRLRELERKAQATRTVYENYLSRNRELGEQQRVDTGNVRVISPALPPNKANGPPSAVVVLFGALLGFATGVAFLALQQALQKWPKSEPVRSLSRA